MNQAQINLTPQQLNLLFNEINCVGTIQGVVEITGENKLVVSCFDGLKRQIQVSDREIIWLDTY